MVRRWHAAAAATAAVLAAAATPPAPTGYDIIVLAGQSNMLGRDGVVPPGERQVLTTPEGIPLVSVEASVPEPFITDALRPNGSWGVATWYRPLRQPFFRYMTAYDVWGWAYEGPSPGATFVSRYVAESLQPGRSVIVVTAAMSGRSIFEFNPAGGQLYARMLAGAQAALRYAPPAPAAAATPSDTPDAAASATPPPTASPRPPLDNRVVALLWLQGESDGSRWGADTLCSYWGRLRTMVGAFRAAVGDPDGSQVAFVAGELSKAAFGGSDWTACSSLDLERLAVHTLGGGAYPAGTNVTAARLGGALPNAALASSGGLQGVVMLDDHEDGPLRDAVHFTAASLLEAGRRLHEALRWLRAPRVREALAVGADPPLPPPLRPPHPCHWSTATNVSGPADSEPFNASALPGRSPAWLLLRPNAPGTWHVASTAATHTVRFALWDAAAGAVVDGSTGTPATSSAASFALRAGLRTAPAPSAQCACGSPDGGVEPPSLASTALPAAEAAGYLATPACGYAFVDGSFPPRGGLGGLAYDPPGADADGAPPPPPHTLFTPYRSSDGRSYVEPLFSVAGVQPRRNGPFGTSSRVMGSTAAPGLGGVWLPLHSAVGYPTDAARRAAEAAGTPYVALVKAVAYVPRLNRRWLPASASDVSMEALPSGATLVVRLPPPPPPPSPTRTRTPAPTRSRSPSRSRPGSPSRPAASRSRSPKRK